MKPDQELERVLRSGSAKERDALAREAPLDMLLPALDSLVRRQNRKLMWASVIGIFIAINTSGRFLKTFFEQLAKHASVVVARDATWVQVLWFLFAAGMFVVGRYKLQEQEAFRAGVRRQASNLLDHLAGRATRNEVGRLCAIYWRTRGSAWVVQEWVQERHVAPSLLNLDDEEAQNLPEDAKRWIRWRLNGGASPEFRVAALLALSSGGDGKVASVARGLTADTDERVRGAASEALKILEARRR